MKKITKKEIKEYISDIKHTAKVYNWTIEEVGAYILNNKINLFTLFKGGSLDTNVFNSNYNSIVYFDIEEQDIDIIQENINEMIEQYNSNREEV